MKISYYHYGELTVGVANYDEWFDYYGLEGVDRRVYNAIVNDYANSTEKAQLRNTEKFIARARPVGGDRYDPTIGERIVRDKLLIKHAERVALKHSIIDKYLPKYFEDIRKKLKHSVNNNVERMDNAYKRLEQYQ